MSEKLEYTLASGRAADLAVMLEGLAEGFRAGRVVVTGGRRRLTLWPRPAVKLKIKAERAGRKGKLHVTVSWNPGLRIG